MATAPTSTLRLKRIASLRRLGAVAKKAAARAASAKLVVKSSKTQLKEARKIFRAEKKAAKQARKKLEAARSALFSRTPKAAVATPKGVAKKKTRAAVTAPPPTKAPAKAAAPKKAKVARKSRRAAKTPGTRAANPMRTAAEVAKSVIERLHNPPPPLPPSPIIPPLANPDSDPAMRP
jgi:hypothetical protein